MLTLTRLARDPSGFDTGAWDGASCDPAQIVTFAADPMKPDLIGWLASDLKPPQRPRRRISDYVSCREIAMLSVLIGVLIICVVGAICFWAIEKFVNEARLANLLKLLVVLICLAAILQRVLPLAGISSF
jgi:hypothetical protein